MQTFRYKGKLLAIKQGDLTEEVVDAIVCPANSFNHMRGGVAALIRMRGGDVIEQEAIAKSPVPVGKAVLTTAGELAATHVIHAPTMKLPVQKIDDRNVRKAVRAALNCADQHHLHSVSFPGMGTGTGQVSYERAAQVMSEEIKRFIDEGNRSLGIVNIVAYSRAFYDELIEQAQVILVEVE